MAKGKTQKKGKVVFVRNHKAEQLAYARGVKKGRKLGWDDGWDAATFQRDQEDERAVMALATLPPKPVETLAPEAVEVTREIPSLQEAQDFVDATVVREIPPTPFEAALINLPIRRFMEPLKFN